MPKVLYVQYANPAAFPPVEYSSNILAEHGFQVKMLGVRSLGSELMELPPSANVDVAIMPYVSPGWRQKVAYLRFLKRSIAIALRWKPDWIYVSDLMASPAGVILGRCLGFKVVYHEHDSPVATPVSSMFMRGLRAARRLLAHSADLIVLPQEQRIKIFQRELQTQCPILQVWNCPRKSETFHEALAPRQPAEPLSVYFHGSINLDRVPLTLITAAARCSFPVRLRVVGYETIGSKGACDQLRAAVSTAGGQVTLEFPGSFPSHKDLRRQMVGMHVGWINFINRSGDINLTHMVGASNKAFDYIAAGLPLIVPQTSGWEEMFVTPGYAKSCDPNDVDGIARVLRWFYEYPADAAAMGRAGQLRTQEEWNYEAQFAPVLGRMCGEIA